MRPWPRKEQREGWELDAVCEALSRNSARQVVPSSRGEGPDAVVRDQTTGETFGVELTSVYLDDRSVPERHKVAGPGVKAIPYDQAAVHAYMLRVINKITEKAEKAHESYDLSSSLILSIYLNEYEAIYISGAELRTLFEANGKVPDRWQIFSEIILWCGSGIRCRIRPGGDLS